MKSSLCTRKVTKKRLFLFIGVLMLGMTNCMGSGFPADVHRENLTLEEAQSLVTFPICLPTYFPDGINPGAQINYDTDSVNTPGLTRIRLIYKRLDSDDKTLEVSQRYTINESVNKEYTNVEAKKHIMVWWISPSFSVEQIRPIVEKVEIQSTSFQTNDILWWLYEITDPAEYQSTMTWWIKNNIEFEVSSFLSAEEIKQTTESMFDCFR